MRDLDGKPTTLRTLPDLGHDVVELLANWLGSKTPYIDNYALPDELADEALLALMDAFDASRLKQLGAAKLAPPFGGCRFSGGQFRLRGGKLSL